MRVGFLAAERRSGMCAGLPTLMGEISTPVVADHARPTAIGAIPTALDWHTSSAHEPAHEAST